MTISVDSSTKLKTFLSGSAANLRHIATTIQIALGLVICFASPQILVTAAATQHPPTFVQMTDTVISSGASASTAFKAATTKGNTIVAYAIWSNSSSATVTDSRGDTFVSVSAPVSWGSGYSAQIFYATNIVGGADTVTATFRNSVSYFANVYIHEYAGISATNAVDVTVAATGASASLNSGSATTTSPNDLIFGAGVSDNTVTAAGAGFTARSFASGNITEDKAAATAGSYAATATQSGNIWAMQMVAFRATGNITPPTVPAGLTGNAVSSSQVNLTWTASTDPNYTASQLTYGCYRNGVRVATTAAGITACSDTGLTASTTYTYTVNAQDPAGNSSAQSASIQVTTQAPAVVITSFSANPTSIIAGQSSTLSWVVSNATSLTIDNGVGTVTGSTSATVHPAVTTTYHLTATNSAGSATAQTTVTITQDVTPPTVPAGLTCSAVSSSQINLNWTASTDNIGVVGYRVYRNGSLIATSGTTSYSDTGLGANTTYSYTVAAYDAAGNASAQSSPVTATTSGGDAQPPTVSISAPSAGAVLNGSVTITANAADNVGVAGVQFYVDGTTLGQLITTAPYSITWNTALAANSSHVLTATASDAAGNMATSAGVTVTVNNTTSNKPYGTNFPLTENPISENNNWINGLATGLDWGDVQTTAGLAFGTTLSIGPPYNDSTAVLSGAWGPNQTAQATVYTVNQNSSIFEEVELRLRTTITAHSITGYEINFRCTSDGSQYVQIVRWNGPINNFTYVPSSGGAGPGLHNGDVIMATVNGSTITAYINGTQIVQGTDSTFTNGSPGIGFYLQGGSTGVLGNYGFTNFSASDGSASDTTPPSTPVNVSAVGVSPTQINLAWTASTDNVVVTGYQIFRNNIQVATSPTNSFSDTGLNPNTQYSYAVAAFDEAGNVSVQSLPVIGATAAFDNTPPTVPSGLKSTSVGPSSISLSWTASTDNVGVAGYQVFRNGNLVGTTASTSYTDSGLAVSTTYDYSVAAFDASNNYSAQSPQIMVTTVVIAQHPPTFVQMTDTVISSGGNASLAFNSATTHGNTIVAYVIWSNSSSATVTDSGGNTFVSVSAPVSWGSGYSAQIFYATNIVGGADTVTATFRNSVSYFANVYIHEYAGISATNAVDVTVAATGASASLNSGSATTTSPNDLIFGAGVSDNTVTAAGAGFTARSFDSGNITEDEVATTPGSYAATATQAGNIWGMQMVAFRAAN